MEPLALANVHDPYTVSYVPDTTLKSDSGESSTDNDFQSQKLDQNNFAQTNSKALDDTSSHSSAFGSAGNIYTNAAGLSDTTSTLYSRESTRHESDKTDLSPAALDPSIAFSNHPLMGSAQFPRPRFPGDQSDEYSYTDHPPYTQNPFVYFQPNPPRKKEATYQPSYSQLYPTVNQSFSNVICDPHQPGQDSKSRPSQTSADAVHAERTKTSEQRQRDQKWSSLGIILAINFRFFYKYLRVRR